MTFIRKIMIYANIIVIAGMILTGYAGVISPADHPFASLFPFAFPAFLIANFAFLIGWAILCLRNVWLPLLGFVLAYSLTQTYFPINKFADHPDGSIKVLSYNVRAFSSPDGEPNHIVEYLIHSDADVICIQEFGRIYGQDSLLQILDSVYQYQDTIRSQGYETPNSDVVGIMSKFPIVHKEILPIVTAGNTAGVFDIKIKDNIVHVINVHLQSVGLSEDEKNTFSELVHGNTDTIAVKQESKFFAHKIAKASAIRAPQADVIDNYIRRHRGEQILLMGDFNDPPLSYVNRTIASRLTDCYREAGHWTGYSFHYHSMHFRIDNIMCSDNWRPYECVVDKSCGWSDHYPIYCYLKSENNKE